VRRKNALFFVICLHTTAVVITGLFVFAHAYVHRTANKYGKHTCFGLNRMNAAKTDSQPTSAALTGLLICTSALSTRTNTTTTETVRSLSYQVSGRVEIHSDTTCSHRTSSSHPHSRTGGGYGVCMWDVATASPSRHASSRSPYRTSWWASR